MRSSRLGARVLLWGFALLSKFRYSCGKKSSKSVKNKLKTWKYCVRLALFTFGVAIDTGGRTAPFATVRNMLSCYFFIS